MLPRSRQARGADLLPGLRALVKLSDGLYPRSTPPGELPEYSTLHFTFTQTRKTMTSYSDNRPNEEEEEEEEIDDGVRTSKFHFSVEERSHI